MLKRRKFGLQMEEISKEEGICYEDSLDGNEMEMKGDKSG